MKIKIGPPSLSARRKTGLCLSFQVEGQVPERSIGLAWKACVGLNQPWVRIPPCPTLLRTERFALVLRRVKGQGIHSAGRENWLGLRVTGDQSHPVRIVTQEDTMKKFRRDSFVTDFAQVIFLFIVP